MHQNKRTRSEGLPVKHNTGKSKSKSPSKTVFDICLDLAAYTCSFLDAHDHKYVAAKINRHWNQAAHLPSSWNGNIKIEWYKAFNKQDHSAVTTADSLALVGKLLRTWEKWVTAFFRLWLMKSINVPALCIVAELYSQVNRIQPRVSSTGIGAFGAFPRFVF